MALIDGIEQKSFLGPEFATWLWRRSEIDEDGVALGKNRTCQVHFEKDLLLAGETGDATDSTFKGETPTLSPEAAAALAAGKKVKRARIRLVYENAAYEFSLDGEKFDWKSLKIDTPPSLPFNEAVPLRMAALEQFHELFESLWGRFLDLRLHEDKWRSELADIRAWIAEKLQARED